MSSMLDLRSRVMPLPGKPEIGALGGRSDKVGVWNDPGSAAHH